MQRIIGHRLNVCVCQARYLLETGVLRLAKIRVNFQWFSTADSYQFTPGTPSERSPFTLQVAVKPSMIVLRLSKINGNFQVSTVFNQRLLVPDYNRNSAGEIPIYFANRSTVIITMIGSLTNRVLYVVCVLCILCVLCVVVLFCVEAQVYVVTSRL
jgi:hypothetical protein